MRQDYFTAVWGELNDLVELLGRSTAYAERNNLTIRLFNVRLTRKTLAFSKEVNMHWAAVSWENSYYNQICPHKSIRLRTTDDPNRKWNPRTPTVAAGLIDHIWTVNELLTTVPIQS